MSLQGLSERDRAEVERSAAEASKAALAPVEVERYLDPPENTPYGLEYAFYLLGDIKGKTVLDLGCGTGENLLPLIKRGASVIGMDISPDLVDLARQRLRDNGIDDGAATLQVRSVYETGLPDGSVDIVFSMALLHHLDLPRARNEIYRILKPGGRFILREPIRFSRSMNWLRKLLPARTDDVSEYEHPMTRQEIAVVTQGFAVLAERNFRLPFVPLLRRFKSLRKSGWKLDRWLLQHIPALESIATGKVMNLQK